MNTAPDLKILRPEDAEPVLAFARSRLQNAIDDPVELQFAEWSAPWRREALEHYLKSGWSFGAQRGDQLTGFAMAQPFLFFKGMTQTVWVEHLEADDEHSGQALVETLYRWSRDKHIQKLIFNNAEKAQAWSQDFKGQRTAEGWWELNATKIKA